jgi:hypothetical protein
MMFGVRWIIALLPLAALFAGLAGCAPRGPGSDEVAIRWGQPADGFQAGLAVKEVTAGERPRAVLVFALRNAGDKQVRFLRLSVRSGYWGSGLPVEVMADGKPCAYVGPQPGRAKPPPQEAYLWLAPGAEDMCEAAMSPELWGLRPPFAAEVTFVFGEARSGAVRVRAGR